MNEDAHTHIEDLQAEVRFLRDQLQARDRQIDKLSSLLTDYLARDAEAANDDACQNGNELYELVVRLIRERDSLEGVCAWLDKEQIAPPDGAGPWRKEDVAAVLDRGPSPKAAASRFAAMLDSALKYENPEGRD